MIFSSVPVHIKKTLPKPTIVFDTYWKFAAERQNVFFRRLENPAAETWTNDAVLKNYKFTNAYRVTDRVSQYLISEVIKKGSQTSEEVFFRIMLFKLFNKIKTWEYLTRQAGEIKYSDFDFTFYSDILEQARSRRVPIYSNAYMMASGKSYFNHIYKHQNHLRLLQKMMEDHLPAQLFAQQSMKAGYEKLLTYPCIGSFLAYQYITDINYSDITNFSEMEFVKAGPGARDGIRKCFSDFGDFSEEDIIKMLCDNQESEFERRGLDFKNLWGRNLQLIDCQNLFCETDKYSRIVHPEFSGETNRTRIKQKFKPASVTPINYVFPDKWKLEICM